MVERQLKIIKIIFKKGKNTKNESLADEHVVRVITEALKNVKN